MLTAILTGAVLWCMFYGRSPTAVLAVLCAGLAMALAVLGRHRHTHILSIDALAQVSRLNAVNPAFKFWSVLALTALCVASATPFVGLFLAAACLCLVVCAGGLPLREYVRLLALPVSFLMLSGLALLVEITPQRTGVLAFPAFGAWVCVGAAAQVNTTLVMARAFGAVSCLYLLSLTTPMHEIIGALRRAHCPGVLVELMYLIYRYVFVLLSMYHTMKSAAKSRLGFAGCRASVRTTGNVYANLLARSYRQAGRSFDAMESRCYEAGIRFLERRKPLTVAPVAVAAGMAAVALALAVLLR